MNPEKYEPKQPLTKIEQAEEPQDILTEQTNKYEFDQIEHELILKYQPKFLAKGGEHIIYEIPEHPDIVVKAETGLLEKIIEWNAEHGLPIDALPEEFKPRIHKYLKQEATRHQELKKYFGADHVPSQKEFLVKIPITKSILNALYENNPPATTNEAWSVVMVQKRVDALNDPNRLSIISGYVEYGKTPEDLNNQATEHFVFGKNLKKKIEKEKLFEIQTHSNLKILLEKSENDKNLKKSLKELVEKIISYTEKTGEIFDLAGQDNILLSQKDGKWTYTLVDTQFSCEGKMIEKAKATLDRLSVGSEIDEQEKHVLLKNQIFFSCRKDYNQLKPDKKFTSHNKLYLVTEIYIY